jgi:hypothetical protein
MKLIKGTTIVPTEAHKTLYSGGINPKEWRTKFMKVLISLKMSDP